MNNNAIVLENVSKVYTQKKRQLYALKDINLQIKQGEFVSIVGQSGSGKTTLLNIISAMIRPNEGNVYINGTEIGHAPEKTRTMIRRDVVATIYQDHNLIPVLNAFQNVELPLRLKPLSRQERKEIVSKTLDLVGLAERKDHRPSELSGGEKQRVAIARTLATKPKIIFADEPTGSLDVQIGDQIIKLLQNENKNNNTTLVLVTHDLQLAEKADRVIRINKGQIIEIREGKLKS